MPAHAPSPGGPSMLGATLGGYKLVREIGRGGMGAVYLAEHTRIVRQAAVKVLLPAAATSPEAVQRFFAEARAASMIQHPGIVEVFDCDVTADGAAFIVMEHLHGASLREFVGKGLSRDLAAIADLGGQIATAMAAAHDRGIVHRDLKPDNVFLCEDASGRPRVKLLDFGIAKLLAAADAPALTTEGVVMGTPRYMSPEQCNGSRDVGPASDIYSLGCILFEMACGRAPFVADTATALLIAHVSQPPPPPSSMASAVPPALDALIVQMLAKAPGDRPAGMREVQTRLADLAEPAPTRRAEPTLPGATETTAVRISSTPPAPALATTARPAPAPSAGPAGTSRRRAAWPRLALAAAGLLGLVSAAWILVARAQEARRAEGAAARARIDGALSEAGEIPAPPACRTSDADTLARLASTLEAIGPASAPAAAAAPRLEGAASAEEWAMQARAHLAASEDAAALAAAERAIAACPEYASAHYLAGKAADRLGQREKAADEYRRALAGNDGFIPPRYNLALLQLKAGDAAGAAATLDEVVARRPDPRALLLRAQARLDTADLPGAESDLREVVRVAPAQADAWALLGTLHARRGEYEDAKRAFCRGKELGSAAAAANCRE